MYLSSRYTYMWSTFVYYLPTVCMNVYYLWILFIKIRPYSS